MVDVVSKRKRSQMMAGIKGKDTSIELLFRKALHRKGYRYRLHQSTLPGKPDMVFPKYNAIILINGCFWHGHNCHLFKMPTTRTEFWTKKIGRNIEKDNEVREQLSESGWRILTIWECSVKGKTRLEFEQIIKDIENWLGIGEMYREIRGKEC